MFQTLVIGRIMRAVARQRREPPSTPFGAWLQRWFGDHPAVTHAAFAQDVGVSKGLITQWIGGTIPKAPTLAKIAKRTGEPLDNLERMLYGTGTIREPEASSLILTRAELQTMLDAAASQAVRALMRELEEGRTE